MIYYLSGQKGVDKYYVRYIEITNETVNSSYFLCSLVTGHGKEFTRTKCQNRKRDFVFGFRRIDFRIGPTPD